MCTRRPGKQVRPPSGPCSVEKSRWRRQKPVFRFCNAILECGRQDVFQRLWSARSLNQVKFQAGDAYNANGKLFSVCRRRPVAMFQDGHCTLRRLLVRPRGSVRLKIYAASDVKKPVDLLFPVWFRYHVKWTLVVFEAPIIIPGSVPLSVQKCSRASISYHLQPIYKLRTVQSDNQCLTLCGEIQA